MLTLTWKGQTAKATTLRVLLAAVWEGNFYAVDYTVEVTIH